MSLRRRDSDGAHGTWHYAPDPPDAATSAAPRAPWTKQTAPSRWNRGVQPGRRGGPGRLALARPHRRLGGPRTRDAGDLDLYVFAHGRDFAGAVADLQRLAGPTPLLPRWALGKWWSRYHAYSDAEYRGLIERFAAEGCRSRSPWSTWTGTG